MIEMKYDLSTVVELPFEQAVAKVRDALAEQGFGVLTEIDVQATMREKLGAESAPYLILGACNPPLAHRALEADPLIGLLLPCNVVVRADGPDRTLVHALDPRVMSEVAGNDNLQPVADDAGNRIRAALALL